MPESLQANTLPMMEGGQVSGRGLLVAAAAAAASATSSTAMRIEGVMLSKIQQSSSVRQRAGATATCE